MRFCSCAPSLHIYVQYFLDRSILEGPFDLHARVYVNWCTCSIFFCPETVTEQTSMVPRERLRPPGGLRSWICFVPVHMSLHASGYATAIYIS